jgi:hypothetical protein
MKQTVLHTYAVRWQWEARGPGALTQQESLPFFPTQHGLIQS